jgi:LmbE family N-acetylglucosaminyl deacetylase
LTISAHQDDIEIMAAGPIIECFQQPDKWFSGVVVTDGRGSPRDGLYKDYDDEEMRKVRFKEQHKAAFVGEYAAQIILDYPSRVVKDAASRQPVEDLAEILRLARPQFVFTHNLADKHDTHVASALKVIAAIRSLPAEGRPHKLYGCEVWRDLDWMVDEDKIAFDLTTHEALQAALLGVFDSQIAGGKRYDLASMGRRRANATYYASLGIDSTAGLSYAMDMTPLILDPTLDILDYVQGYIHSFAEDVTARFHRVG